MLSDAYDKGQEQRGQVKRDLEVGKERGKQVAGNGAPDGKTEQAAAAFRRFE